MSDPAPATRDQIAAAIAEKAWKDEAFHKEILANPAKLYEQHFGEPLPPGMTLKVLEDTATTVHFVLPAKPANAATLSDAELEQVAGGATPAFAVAGVTFIGTFTIKVGLHAGNVKW